MRRPIFCRIASQQRIALKLLRVYAKAARRLCNAVLDDLWRSEQLIPGAKRLAAMTFQRRATPLAGKHGSWISRNRNVCLQTVKSRLQTIRFPGSNPTISNLSVSQSIGRHRSHVASKVYCMRSGLRLMSSMHDWARMEVLRAFSESASRE